jgi:D-glycero-D-manno-heptose 1,7-bisphosphate phosphatase
MSLARAIFLDRDGVLNDLVYYADTGEHESPRTSADFRLLPDVTESLQRLQSAGWILFVVSNQPSYAKGKCTLDDLHGVEAALASMLAQHDIAIRDFYYDYTHPQAVLADYRRVSLTRKPAPGFLLQAAQDHAIDLTQSWMVGDRDTDIQCGQAAGCQTALITTSADAAKRGQSHPDLICDTLTHVVDTLLKRETHTHANPR